MNIKEIRLEELELHSYLYEEGLSCLLNTILFVRAPGPVRPVDYHCKRITPLTYAKCGVDDVEETIRTAISDLSNFSLQQVAPNLSRGVVTLSFYEKREVKGIFGMFSSEEKVYFERWKISILINDTAFPREGDPTHELNRMRLIEDAREKIKKLLFTIFEIVNTSIDHVPSSMYEFEIETSVLSADKRENKSMVTRLINTQSL